MGREQLACWREGQGCVVVFLCLGVEFGDGAADQICICFCGHGREGVEGGRLLFCGWGGEQGFGVGGEVVAAVGGVEAFGEDDDLSAGFGSF